MRRATPVLFFALALVVSTLAGIPPVLAQGTVYTDTMDSAQTGLLSTQTSDPTISFAYQNSQFVVNVQQPSYRGDIISPLNVPELASSRLTVDALISGDPANKYVIAGCRHTDAGEGYFFGYLPATGDIIIWRRDASGDTNIAQSTEPTLIASPNTTYQIGIDCWTNIVTGIIDGQPVLSAFDPTYTTGRPAIGVGANGQETDGLTVSFDNLQVVDNGNLVLGPETPTVLETPVTAQGTVYTDTMDSAQTGLLSTQTFDPTVSFAYQNSQFVVTVQQPAFQGDITSELSVPELANSRLLVDALIGGSPANKYVIAGCRHTESGEGYFFGYLPATGDILIWRRDASGDTNLAESVEPSSIAPANTMYQVGIECQGNTISGSVNGQPVLSASDSTYTTGRPTIGVGANGQETDGVTVAFDNLQVVDYGNMASSSVTPAVSETPAVLETPATLKTASTVQSAPIRDPNADPAGTLEDAFTVSLHEPPLVSDLGGNPELTVGNIQTLSAGVQVADFYAEFYYTAPTVPANSSYLVGFCFWIEPDGSCYDVYLTDDGTGAARWGYGYDPAVGDYQPLLSDAMPAGNIDPTPGARNFLGLAVYQGYAILSGNNFDTAAVIPLQGTPLTGDVEQELSLLAHEGATVTDTMPISISDFAVWDLSSGLVPVVESSPVSTAAALSTAAPAAGDAPQIPPSNGIDMTGGVFEQNRALALANAPLASGLFGTLTQEQDVYDWAPANVSVADFYTIVTFTSPSDLSVPSDVGIGFRAAQDSESGLRIVFWSDGSWYLQQGSQTDLASGVAPSFDVSPGAVNTIELLAMGSMGMLAVNGTIIGQIDLSSLETPGDIFVGTGFFTGDTMSGRQVPYANWWVYPISVLDIPSG